MKTHLLTLLFVVGALFLGTAHTELAVQSHEPMSTSNLADWGVTSNPDSDCRFFITEGMLLIHVPGGPRPHDLAAEIDIVNAPRVLQKAKGDFTIQVQVDGRFAPGGESMLPGRTGYNGAGLVAVFNESNVVTLARAVLQRTSGPPIPYANFEIRKDGKLERFGMESDLPIPLDKPVTLRLERRGLKMLGSVSIDGSNWQALEPKSLPDNWPRELQVGVIAISTSKDEFNPRFSKLEFRK